MTLSFNEILEKNTQTGRGVASDGSPRAFTAKEFFEISCDLGENQTNPAYRALFERFAFWINAQLSIGRALEIGSGPGYLLYCLNRLGIDATGIDGNSYSRDFFRGLHPEFEGKYILDPLFKRNYGKIDALFSIEVFEHINDDALNEIMSTIRDINSPKYIVFSSTPFAVDHPNWDFQWGHINIKQPAEWDAFFKTYGFERNLSLKPPITEWACIYQNTQH